LEGVEVIGVIALFSTGKITVHDDGVITEETKSNPIMIEQPSQEELQGVTHMVSLSSKLVKSNSEALNLAVFTNEFDVDMFDENVDTEQHIKEGDETARSESDEEKRQPPVYTTSNAAVDAGGEGNEANVPSSTVTPCDVPTSSHIDWGSYYTNEELRALKLKHITLQDYLNHET
jgi:hypothetical protein